MKMKVGALLGLIVLLGLGLVSCGHYTCGATFGGGSSCTPSGGGIGSGGNGTGATDFAFFVSQTATMGGIALVPNKGLEAIPNFNAPALPAIYTVAAMAVVQNKFLYAAIAENQNLYAWSIDAAGNLTAIAPPYHFSATLPLAAQPLNSMTTNPAGTLLFIADPVGSQIEIFSIDPSTGALTALPAVSTAGVIQPWNLATDGLGNFLYVTQGLVVGSSGQGTGEGTVMAVYTINSSTGALTNGFPMSGTHFNMWQVASEPTGNFMIGSDGETGVTSTGKLDNNIYVFSIDQSTGLLTNIATALTTFGSIRVIVHPSGQFVYAFSIDPGLGLDAKLDGFTLTTTTNPTTATLTKMAPFNTTTVPYDGYFDQTGNNLFVHSSGNIGVFSVDSFGNLTEPFGTFSAVGDKAWVATSAHP
jgi:6-phosphogluconolactonase (cycloisomerase 2 family)